MSNKDANLTKTQKCKMVRVAVIGMREVDGAALLRSQDRSGTMLDNPPVFLEEPSKEMLDFLRFLGYRP